MNDEIAYTDGEIDEVRVIADFLPPPAELVFRQETVKVTIALSRESVEFFKREANKHGVPYQKMIRRLLDEYAGRFGADQR
jgi:predicted DNA binding CopG/RHH family protein